MAQSLSQEPSPLGQPRSPHADAGDSHIGGTDPKRVLRGGPAATYHGELAGGDSAVGRMGAPLVLVKDPLCRSSVMRPQASPLLPGRNRLDRIVMNNEL